MSLGLSLFEQWHSTVVERIIPLSVEMIHEMERVERSDSINNVLEGFEPQCYGLRGNDESDGFPHELYYISGEPILTGVLLPLNFNIPHHGDLMYVFCRMLEDVYPHLNAIDACNTYHKLMRSMLEKAGYMTITGKHASKLARQFPNHEFAFFRPGKHSIRVIPFIDKAEVYGDAFTDVPDLTDDNSFIYLTLNSKNGLVKIGHSKTPYAREKTLLGDDPYLKMVVKVRAPRELETELHRMFKPKRVRGEWFNLQTKDVMAIRRKLLTIQPVRARQEP